MSNKVEKALGIIADHFKGLELSETPQAGSYTAEKGSVQNIIRGSEIACKSALNLQHEIGARLKGRVRQFSGSEIEDVAIQKDTFAVKQLQEQVACLVLMVLSCYHCQYCLNIIYDVPNLHTMAQSQDWLPRHCPLLFTTITTRRTFSYPPIDIVGSFDI